MDIERQMPKLKTPTVIIDLHRVRRRYRSVRQSFGNQFEIFFAIKANSHPDVIRTVGNEGGGFDVASLGEVRQVLELGYSPERIAFSNPVKSPNDIAAAYAAGVRLFAFDSPAEVAKLSHLAPNSTVYLRLAVDNTGSGWPLAGKYGALSRDAVRLLELADQNGLDAAGLTFHVGSQCLNLDNWVRALETCAEIGEEAWRKGIGLRLLNLGGGLPSAYNGDTPTVGQAAAVIRRAVSCLPWAERLILEPGRYLTACSGKVVASVIGTAERDDCHHVFLDVGLFNGLMEAYEAFWYPVRCYSSDGQQLDGPKQACKLFGPTCDSVDLITKDIILPQLKVGDKLVFSRAGAYTNSYKVYNGFDFMGVQVMDSA